MAKNIHDGGQAFPIPEVRDEFGDIVQRVQPGMTLRDWFAGQAITSVVAKMPYLDCDQSAAACYRIADAMLTERLKQ